METFAAKVKYGGETRFDPLLEERWGWIAGETCMQDSEIMEVVLENMAQVSEKTADEAPNPFKEQLGEILLADVERNYSGFLVREKAISFKVNSEKLVACIAILKE